MKIKELIDIIEQVAPVFLQESYDNSGLIIGNKDMEITGALLAVDVTEKVIDEAIEKNCNIIVSHHPLIFHPLKNITGENATQRAVIKAIKNDIALYASHTPLDQIPLGLSHSLAQQLGIQKREILSLPNSKDPNSGFGIIGEKENPCELKEILSNIKKTLGLKAIRYAGEEKGLIKKIALCTGSGSSLISTAIARGAELYISADFKYNDFLDADKEIIIADIGHFESEYCAINVLFDIITKKITTFVVHKSEKSENPVNYFV